MRWRRLSALLVLLHCPIAAAGNPELGSDDRAKLIGYARDTWRSFDALALPSGLPSDSLSKTAEGWTSAHYTSPSDIAAYLWSILAAEDLHIIGREESADRMGRTLGALARLDRSNGFFLNWYDPRDGSPLKTWPGGGPVRPFLSTVDNGWLAAALMMVRNARPAFRTLADELLGPMDFGFFYDPFDASNPVVHPGLLRGGFYTDDRTFAGYHYGMLNTEARIASYVGIARGQLPREHYFRMSRSRPNGGEPRPPTFRGVPWKDKELCVEEGYNAYRGMRIVPSWDGSMFEALMVTLFVPEARWSPAGWGINHPLYVRASIEAASKDAGLEAWGASPSSIPGGGYRVYGVPALSVEGRGAEAGKETVITPHASFLALEYAPREAMTNVETLATRFHAYGQHGFLDAVDVRDGKLAECELALDQGMILAAVANALADDTLRNYFCQGQVAEIIQPLIAPERFSAGREPREPNPPTSPGTPAWRVEAFDRPLDLVRRLGTLGGSILTTTLVDRSRPNRWAGRSFGDINRRAD